MNIRTYTHSDFYAKLKTAVDMYEIKYGEAPLTVALCTPCQEELKKVMGKIPFKLDRKPLVRQTLNGVERCIIHNPGVE